MQNISFVRYVADNEQLSYYNNIIASMVFMHELIVSKFSL